MTITLTGENDALRLAAVQSLVADFTAAYGDIAIERLDGDEASLALIEEALTSLPFLSARKMVILRSPSDNKQFIEKAELLLAALPDTTDLVLVEPKLDKRLSYYKTLKKQTDFRDFTPLDERGLAQWLVGEAKKQSGSLSQTDALFLVGRVGTNQQLLANELEKLLLHNSTITRQTIELLTEATPQSTIFELIEAAFSGNPRRALALYEEQRALKVEPPQIIAMLAWQLHVLALIATAGKRSLEAVAGEAKLSPYVVRKTASVAKSLSRPQIKALVQRLAELDAQLKRQPIDPDEALKQYLLELSPA